MVRNIPIGDSPPNNPLLSVSLFVACIAATLAIISSLCGSLTRKKSPPSLTSETETKEGADNVINPSLNEATSPPPPNEERETIDIEDKKDPKSSPQDNDENIQQPLPPPPGMAHMRAASCHVRSASSASQGKLAPSMSMRAPGPMLGFRQASKRDDHSDKKRDKKLKQEDSIWKKTIILGEKCKVPEDEEDTIIYDEKGRKISTFHRKTPTGVSLSRQSSNIDSDAVPGEQEKR